MLRGPLPNVYSSASFSGGRPQGSSIFCSKLYLMRPTDSFSATARYVVMLWWPIYDAKLSLCMLTAHSNCPRSACPVPTCLAYSSVEESVGMQGEPCMSWSSTAISPVSARAGC